MTRISALFNTFYQYIPLILDMSHCTRTVLRYRRNLFFNYLNPISILHHIYFPRIEDGTPFCDPHFGENEISNSVLEFTVLTRGARLAHTTSCVTNTVRYCTIETCRIHLNFHVEVNFVVWIVVIPYPVRYIRVG